MRDLKENNIQDANYICNRVKNYIRFMCKKCKFYRNGCIKGRLVENCAREGQKNKEE